MTAPVTPDPLDGPGAVDGPAPGDDRRRPVVPLLWRTPTSVQFGTGPGRTIVLDGVDPTLARALAAWQCHGDVRALAGDAVALGVPAGTARRVTDELTRAGLGRRPATTASRVRLTLDDPVRDQLAALLVDTGLTVSVGVGEPTGPPDDLVVVDDHVSPAVLRGLARDDVAHLLVSTAPSSAVVGPLVVPGRSTCLACVDLHRRDHDPCWPQLSAQLRWPGRRYRTPAWLVSATAAQATAQILHAVSAAGPGPCTDGSLELTEQDWRWRRRSWGRHPECGCAR